jgi:hypothetical protein
MDRKATTSFSIRFSDSGFYETYEHKRQWGCEEKKKKKDRKKFFEKSRGSALS